MSLDNLKVIEFELIIKQFPQVKYAANDHCDVDYRALAQHYELNTDLIDVTSDIAVAAFFATHVYDMNTKDYRVKEDGVGCIRTYTNVMIEPETKPFRMIGLQPFQRPGQQCAFAVKMDKGENFAEFSRKILFKQNVGLNQRIHQAFYPQGKNILFPNEEICEVADLVRSPARISEMAVDKYCQDHTCGKDKIGAILKRHRISINDRLPYALTRQQRRKLERKYEGKPYGDVKAYFRACYTPPTEINNS